jgi:gluconate 2-dehydrogenase gamma chain
MKTNQTARREFLLRTGGAAAVALANAQWPAIVSAAQHAHEAAKSSAATRFEVLTPEQARNVEAIAAQIIPSDDLPGAREAGVVYFIDRALKTFAKDTVPVYQKGLAEANRLVSEKHPGVKSFADGTPAQQESVMAILAETLSPSPNAPRRRRNAPGTSGDFMQTIWQHTVYGFLADPDAGGNRDYAGWKVINRDPAHSFSPPFGFYDKDYPGWEAAALETEKK